MLQRKQGHRITKLGVSRQQTKKQFNFVPFSSASSGKNCSLFLLLGCVWVCRLLVNFYFHYADEQRAVGHASDSFRLDEGLLADLLLENIMKTVD